jgi:proteasome lid subunit RPN8/RPN11
MLPIYPLALHVAPIDREMLTSQAERYGGILATLSGPLFPDEADPDDLSVPPVPYDQLAVMKIAEDAHDSMMGHLAGHEPEVAGALMAVKGTDLMTRFIADEWGHGTGASFTFGTAELNRVIRPHIERGEEVIGIVHSHPRGFRDLSYGDRVYFTALFRNPKNEGLDEFWCPIFENGTLHVYQARRDEANGEINFVRARVEIVPAQTPIKKRHTTRSLDTTRIKKLIDVKKMKRSTVTLVGTGGGANLVRCNLGSLNLIDFDRVEGVNICRQEHAADAVGSLKVETLAAELRRINPTVRVECFARNFCDFDDEQIAALFADTDLFVCPRPVNHRCCWRDERPFRTALTTAYGNNVSS